MTVCIFGTAFLLIHIVDLLLKKNRRKDENNLLIFFGFTVVHLVGYLLLTIFKAKYASDPLIITSYSCFYVANNLEVLLLYIYTISYIKPNKLLKDVLTTVNIVLFTLFNSMVIVNIFNHMLFTSVNGVYTRGPFMIISQGYQLVAFAIVFAITVLNKKLKVTERIAFSIYCLLPLVAIMLQNAFQGYAIAYLSIVVSIEILFLFVNVQKNIDLANEAKRSQEVEVRLMMSQIQPHFIYNVLSSISTLIKIDPEKAQKGLDTFTEYLRANLSSMTGTGLIPFSDEFKHIVTYLALEKMRFEDRLSVEYDIQTKDFKVPPLSIQPLVENSVKHGILKNIEGGKIKIKTYEDNEAHYVDIDENGVGFDITKLKKDDNKHFGINNVSYRLKTMCHSDIKIDSEVGKGTHVVIKFYKE